MLGVTFGSKHSYNDWGIWLEDTHINPPLPKRYIVDVPARNGLLDLTPELTPTIRFENRTLTFKFRVKAGDWSTLVSQIHGDIHGRTLDVVSDLDPQWHWHGCVTVDDFSSDERTGVLVITVDAYPFKLSNTENSYTVNGNGTITCVVDRMEISPAFELTAPTTVIYGDSSYVLESTATTEKTLSGDIVSFADGTANPAIDLTADIDAVQDLHGYDYPWVGGAGKNLYIGSPSFDGYTNIGGYTIQTEKYNGHEVISKATAWNGAYKNVNVKANTTYTFSAMIKVSAPANVCIYNATNQVLATRSVSSANTWSKFSATFTPSADTTEHLRIETQTSGVTIYLSEYQLEVGSSATTYEPYENICPISGWSAVNINVKGKNFLHDVVGHTNPTTVNGVTFTQNSDGSITMNGTTTASTLYYLSNRSATPNGHGIVLPKGTYTLSGIPTGYSSINLRLGYNRGADSSTLGNDTGSGFTFTESIGGTQYGVWIGVNSGATLNNVTVYPMIRLSTDSSTYEPYNGQTYTIDLNGTRYGGTLDVTTGVLTLTHGYVDLGSLNWVANASYSNTFNGTTLNPHAKFVNNITTWKCSDYASYISTIVGTVDAGISIGAIKYIVYVRDIRFNDPATFKTAMSGVQLVYELDTPQVVQLTPTQVMILKNQNNIWADSSEVEVTYLAQDFAGKTFYIPDLELTEGSHELTIQGTGTTKVTYTNGRL